MPKVYRPKVYRVTLTEEERKELRRLKRDPRTKPRMRERLEMIRLSDRGKTLPEIAGIVEPSEQRVRKWVKAFLAARTFVALDDRPHVGRASSLTSEIMAALRTEIEKADRTWSARQAREWLEEQHGLKLSDEQVRRRLKKEGIVWKRTSRTLRHKQKPDAVADRKADLETLEKGTGRAKRGAGPQAGLIDVCHLDEAGFAMTQPVSYSWFPRGERLFVPFEANQGRRVNVIGGYFTHGPCAGRFVFETAAKLPQSKAKKRRKSLEERSQAHGVTAEDVGVIDAEFFLAFIWKLAGRPEGVGPGWKRERPLVIPLDNYSVHTSERVKTEQRVWEEADIHLFYLPSYSPELSEIEPVWQAVKYRELTQRSFSSLGELLTHVKDALLRKSQKLVNLHPTPSHTDFFQ